MATTLHPTARENKAGNVAFFPAQRKQSETEASQSFVSI